MVIIFHLSRLLGLAVGVLICLGACAWAGVVIGATLGISVGYLVGALLHEFTLIGIRLGMKFCDTTKLKARLERDHCLSHLIIGELVSRGEAVPRSCGGVSSIRLCISEKMR
jgi:hypothetical protein